MIRLTVPAAAALLVCGCAHSYFREGKPIARHDLPGLEMPELIGCATQAPEPPPEVRAGKLYGVVLVNFIVHADGEPGDFELADSRGPKPLFEAVQRWLSTCRYSPATRDGKAVPVELSEAYGFRAPVQPDPDEPAPLEKIEQGQAGRLTPPVQAECPYVHNGEVGRAPVRFVVHRDGHVGEVEPLPGTQIQPDLFKLVRLWLESCPFTPASLDGQAIAMRSSLRADFLAPYRSQASEGPSRLPDRGPLSDAEISNSDEEPVTLEAGQTHPRPSSSCEPARPQTPLEARQNAITGVVLVEYTVHRDGHIGEVTLKTPKAPFVLFEAVRDWLLGCRFEPSMARGKPVAVRIIQPFDFHKR